MDENDVLDTAENWSSEGWYECIPQSIPEVGAEPDENESVSEFGESGDAGKEASEDASGDAGKSAGEEAELFTLKHLDRTQSVSRDEVIKLAQKGLDYDRVKAKYSELSELKSKGAGEAEVLDAEASLRAKRDAEFGEFIERMPEVLPEDIPREVWAEVAEGKSLLTAYAMYENARLKAELQAVRQNRNNREVSVSSRSSEGSRLKLGELERLWYAED